MCFGCQPCVSVVNRRWVSEVSVVTLEAVFSTPACGASASGAGATASAPFEPAWSISYCEIALHTCLKASPQESKVVQISDGILL